MIRQADYCDLDWGNIKSGGSIGMLSKTIIKKSGKNYYVKLSAYNKHHGVYGIESISEVIASRLAKIMKIPCIDMKLVDALITKDEKTFRTYLCVSPDYKKAGDVVVPFEDDYELSNSLYANRDEKEVIQPDFYIGNDNMGNNYVGSRSLLENIINR
jgi:hypothetical protein